MAENLKPQIEKPVDPYQLNFAFTPIQTGDEIRLAIQVNDIAGIYGSVVLTISAARQIMYKLREGIEAAETTIVKPQSMIASA